jgi:dihydroorotate dehydrogenase (fumarate)
MDLSTTYLGLKLANPLMPGSSPLCDDVDVIRRLIDYGAAAIVLHSLFEEQKTHEFVDRMWSHGLGRGSPEFPHAPNPFKTPQQYLKMISGLKHSTTVPIIASINCVTNEAWTQLGSAMESAGADALELNVYSITTHPRDSASDVENRLIDVVHSVAARLRIPVAVKLCPFYTSLPHLTERIQQAGARGLVLFHRFYQPDFSITTKSADATLRLSHVADPTELRLRLHWLAILSRQTSMSLAVSGGVHTGLDAVKGIMAGAHAAQMVSSLLNAGPGYLADVLESFRTFMEALGFASVESLRGCMTYHDPADAERGGYRSVLGSWKRQPGAVPT